VAAFRRFLKANSKDASGKELLAAKMAGCWRSGAPLNLAPESDDPAMVADAIRLNTSDCADDPESLVCPRGAHIRRTNPRDAIMVTLGDPRIHRIIRPGAIYGSALPDGVLWRTPVRSGVSSSCS
jgi:deferrochelatase/peroxidase EfeB